MPQSPNPSSHRRRRSDEDQPTTRVGGYAPPPPEQLSRISRLVVRVEIAVAVAVAAGVGLNYYRAHRPDTSPIRISGAALPHASIPASIMPSGAESTASGADTGNAEKGQVLYMQTCTSCHGQRAQGLPHMGLNLRESKFVAGQNDRKLVAFLKAGRKPTDPKNVTGLLMPAKGGNPQLDDDALTDIVAFLRSVQKEEQASQPQEPAPQRQASDDKSSPTAAAPALEPGTRPTASIDARE